MAVVFFAIVFLAVLFFLIVSAQPSFGFDKSQQTVAGAMGLLASLLYTIPPWLTGVVADILVCRVSEKTMKAVLTAILSMVLGYPSIWFSFTAFVLPGGPESIAAWILCATILTITLGAVKVVSFWVINEKFPTKKTALMLFVSALLMVIAAFAVVTFAPVKANPAASTAAPAPAAAPADTPEAATTTKPATATESESETEAKPATEPTAKPTPEPTAKPTPEPTAKPTPEPAASPATAPESEATH